MSQKKSKHDSTGRKENEKKKSNQNNADDPKFRENVIRTLYDNFQDSFGLGLIASVAHTCQWDIQRATEALVILSGRKTPKKTKNSKADRKDGTKNKAKSLPGTLKQEKSKSEKNLHSENLAHHSSTNSLSSGQVWQRHYKSKPQSPGLLTMIPPSSKEIVKLKNASSRKSALKPSQAEVPKASTVIRRIQEYVQNDTKVLILMRGAPGSGKTCMARNVVLSVTNSELSQHILSTDDYFVLLGRGNYAFDSSQLPQAHNWNQKRVSESLKRGINPIVVDNTNTQAWEMRPYVVMAAEHGYLVEVLEPETSWRNKEAELAKRNIHSIPREKIRQMLERYEPGWTGEKLLKLYVLKQSDVTPTPQDVKRSTNPLLEQHRQQDVINIPEKPKRKRNGSKKKIRNNVAGINITEDREKQLEELSKLFAEYGKTMDPVSKQKVLESGVPISEVVSRMRKLQGNILPLPKQTSSNVLETEFNQSCNLVKPVPDYSTPLRDSCSESYDLGAISSSNASEASESETETDTDTDLLKWKETEEYFECETQISFKDGEDITEYKNDDRKSNQVAKKFSSQEEAYLIDFNASGIQSSENHEETLLIDLETTLTPASVSQEDLSILNFNGSDNINSKDSSSSTEEQETQMLSLQESLRDVFIDSTRKSQETSLESSPEKKPNAANNSEKIAAKPFEIELSDSLMNVLSKRFEISESNDRAKESDVAEGGVSINESLLQMLVKKYSADEVENSEIKETNSNTESHIIDNEVSKKSPDLEEVPLPSIPPDKNENESPKFQCLDSEIANNSKSVELSADRPVLKRDNFEDIVNSWNCSIAEESKKDTSPKPARTKNSLLGAKKKTGANTRDKSPDELLRSVDLSWSSVPFTSSWEDVSDKPLESEFQSLPKPQRRFVLKSDSSTNTLHGDFDLWKKEVDGIVKLTAHSRNINQNYRESEIPVSHVSDILMLDKSSMTLDAEEMDSMGREIALETLSGMFPDISKHHLIEILDKCKGNLIWAIEVLLETPQNLANLPDAALIEESPVSCQGAKAIEEPDYVSLQNAMISDGKKTIKRKKEKKSAPSELSLILKKQIEDGIQINEDFYQDRTLFLKKLRHGEIEFGDGPLEPVPEIPAENTVQSYECEEDIEEEETIPMKLDPDFFRILNQQFGSLDGSGKEKEIDLILPVIDIPLSLAQQIYDCWVENVNKQLEDMQSSYDETVVEDELLANALQQQEFEYRQPDLREIMDMELAMLLYKQSQAHTNKNFRETIATKLSKQLLFEAYPNLDKTMLLDLFESEGRSFQKTIDVLGAQENKSPITVVAPEFLALHGNKLLEQAKSENLKKNIEEVKKPKIVVKEKKTKETENDSASGKNLLLVNPIEYRQKMALLHQQRNDCCRLAQEAFRKKSYSVASYFSHIASLYKDRIKELSKEPFSPTIFEDKINRKLTEIDLHFLLVSEALQILDLFLDYHITELRKKVVASTASLSLITGRGQHSVKGIAKVKPAVKKKLMQRKLSFVELNPGMLKVTVHKNDVLSAEM